MEVGDVQREGTATFYMCLKIPEMNSGMQIWIQTMNVWRQEGVDRGLGPGQESIGQDQGQDEHVGQGQDHMIVIGNILQNTRGQEVGLEKGPM